MKSSTFPSIQEAPVLYASPEELPVIDELKKFMKFYGFKNMKEMLSLSGQELLQMEGFGYRCLVSYMNTLQDHQCLRLFRETID